MTSIITPSTVTDNNYTRKLFTSTLRSDSITDGIATFANGTVTNLVPPTNLQDAVTKGFVDQLSSVAPPLNSVQFNNLTFDGSANLTFTPSTLTIAGRIENASGLTIENGTISGLNDPVLPDQIATKSYVDSRGSVYDSYLRSNSSITYTAEQMVNRVVLRNTLTPTYNLTLTDTTASAADLLAYLPDATIGYTFNMKIMNDSDAANALIDDIKDLFVVQLSPGTGVTFIPNNSFVINRGCIVDMTIRFTDIITPLVNIYINSLVCPAIINYYVAPRIGSNLKVINNIVDYRNNTPTLITGNILWNVNPILDVSTNYPYTTDDIKNQFITRSPLAPSTDIFGFNIDFNYLNQMFTIQNPGAFNILLSVQTDIWQMIPPVINVPPTRQTLLSLTKDDKIFFSNIGTYYERGVYNAIGGTGSGMTVTVQELSNEFTITNIGSGYPEGFFIYTTTNLTTPSTTGLTVLGQANVAGEMSNVTLNVIAPNYQIGEILQINGGNNNATVQIVNLNTPKNFDSTYINTIGDGQYVSTDVLTLSGPGTGTGAQFTLGTLVTIRAIGSFPL